MDKVIVKIKGNEYEFESGTTLLEISEIVKDDFKYDIIISKIDNQYRELNEKVFKNCDVEFYDLTDKEANKIYVNGLIFLISHSFKLLFNEKIKVNHSIDKGLYITTDIKITSKMVEQLEDKMLELISKKLKIEKIFTTRMNVLDYYKKIGLKENYETMKYITNAFVTMYKLENDYTYLYSFMPANTGVLNHFALTHLDENSLVLRFPTIYSPDEIKDYTHRKNIYKMCTESRRWAKDIGLEYISDLNKIVSESKYDEIIRMDEAKKVHDIMNLAEKISNSENKKIVLMAGPSSSGKTTTCNRLALSLKSFGLNPKMISMDDFFVERDETPLDKDGNPDFEILEAVDLKLFNQTIEKLLTNEETIMPTYNFIKGKKEFNTSMKLEKNDILLIEGIHALNPKILSNISENKKIKIYLSALTELSIDSLNRISTTDNRLLRRIVRDNRTRGHNVESTLKSWVKVREGEEEYIFPYQDMADYSLNTAMIYEIGVLKIYVEPLLYSVDPSSPYYNDARRLLDFLRLFLPIPPEIIPNDSILREFIGGSCFKV